MARASRRLTTRPQFHDGVFTKIHRGGRQEAGGLSETARRGRRRGARDRRFAGRESNGKDRGSGKKRSEYAAHRSALEKNGESQVSLTDPDSRAMAAHTKVGVGYNIQVAVDAKHKMIVEQEVTNQVLEASEGHSGAGAGNSRGRKNRCGRRQGLFQDRRHRGLRGSRPDAVSAAPATRGGGEERL